MLTQSKQNHPFLDLIISIDIPSAVLMKLSTEDYLGPLNALILALSFPLIYGLYEYIYHKKKNFISILGVISVVLTGGIGVLELDSHWLAVKEAAVPFIIGVAVLISLKTPYPLVRTLLYNPAIINIDRVDKALDEHNNHEVFDKRLVHATYCLSGTFFFSAVLNYVLATLIVTSATGTAAFNEELGELTIKSYFIIALPSMVMLMGILFWLVRSIQTLSQLSLEEIMNIEPASSDPEVKK